MTETCYTETNPDFANLESPNPANQYVGQQFTSGNSLIGKTITKIGMFCYYTGSPASNKFTFCILTSGGAIRAESDETAITELGTSTTPPKYELTLDSAVELDTNDIVAIKTVSAPSGFGIKIQQCDSCSGGTLANSRRAIGVIGSSPTVKTTATINFCVSEGSITSSGTRLPPPPLVVRF